jgi:hypothetical protein
MSHAASSLPVNTSGTHIPRSGTVGTLVDMLAITASDVAAQVVRAELREMPPVPPLLIQKAKDLVVLTLDAVEVLDRLPRNTPCR